MVSLGRSHNGCQTPTDIAPVVLLRSSGSTHPHLTSDPQGSAWIQKKNCDTPNPEVRVFFSPGHASVKIYFFSYIIHIILKYKFFLKLVPQPRIFICVMAQGPECDSVYDSRDHIGSYCSISLTHTHVTDEAHSTRHCFYF